MPKSLPSTPGASAKDMPSMLLDTHVAVWLAEGNSRLKSSSISLIESSFHKGQLCLSSISAWEIGLLVCRNKLDFGQPPLVWFADFVERFRINVIDLTPEIAINSSYLPGKFHGDPADRMLVATAMTHAAVIVTADRNIVSYGAQGFVQVIAC